MLSGPHKLNGGWASNADAWNPTTDGVFMTYQAMQPFKDGCRIMDGFVTAGDTTSATTVQGLFYWQDSGQVTVANKDIYIIVTNAKCYTAPVSTQTMTERTNGKTIPTTGLATFDSLNATGLLCMNGANTTGYGPFTLSTYNGSLGTLGGSPPQGGYIKVVNNFAFISGVLKTTALLSRVYWSNIGDPATWSASNYVDVNLNDGDMVTGLASIGNNLIIFKLNSIWSLSTTSNVTSGSTTLGPLTCISTQYGCVGPLAIDSMPDGSLVFMSNNGHLYQTDGNTFIDLSSNPFPASNMSEVFTPLNFSLITKFNFSPLYSVILKVDSTYNRLVIADSSIQASVYSFDYVRKAWADISSVDSTSNNISYLQVMPAASSSNGFGATSRVLYAGFDNGKIAYFSPAQTQIRTMGNVSYAPKLVKSFVLDAMGPPGFVPRSLVIPLYFANSTNTYGTINIYAGFDGSNPESSAAIATYSLSATTAKYYRLIAPIVIRNGIAGKQPISIQIEISAVGTGANNGIDPFAIGPFYFSDEMLT